MKWALINTVIMPHRIFFIENDVYVDKTYDAPIGTIIEVIAYDGESLYNPPEGLKLVQVPDEASRGDSGY